LIDASPFTLPHLRHIAFEKGLCGNFESATAYNGNCVLSRRTSRTCIHSGQNYYSFSLRNTYHIERILSKAVFRRDYPENPRTFGEHLTWFDASFDTAQDLLKVNPERSRSPKGRLFTLYVNNPG
jgi:hypothetical protein